MHWPAIHILGEGSVGELITWMMVFLAAVIVLFVVVSLVKKHMATPIDPIGPGFSLSDLRQLHRSGQMSDEEFERAKAKVIGASRTIDPETPELKPGTPPNQPPKPSV